MAEKGKAARREKYVPKPIRFIDDLSVPKDNPAMYNPNRLNTSEKRKGTNKVKVKCDECGRDDEVHPLYAVGLYRCNDCCTNKSTKGKSR